MDRPLIDFKGHRFEKDIILLCVRWYLAYPLSYRNQKDMMLERGVEVDHSNIYRWVQKLTPQLEAAFRKGEKRAVGNSWRMDENYVKVKGQWKYLYRAVDKQGKTVDFLLAAQRDKKATLRFFKRAVGQHGLPEKITIDKSAGNAAAIETLKQEAGQEIEMRQIKYLNSIVEQDHRAIKRVVRPMLGLKSFRSARTTLQGIELMHMIKKRQMMSDAGENLSAAEQLYSLAARNALTEQPGHALMKLVQQSVCNRQIDKLSILFQVGRPRHSFLFRLPRNVRE